MPISAVSIDVHGTKLSTNVVNYGHNVGRSAAVARECDALPSSFVGGSPCISTRALAQKGSCVSHRDLPALHWDGYSGIYGLGILAGYINGVYMSYRLGLDTGGTYTDAVVVDEQSNIVASAKALTTHDNLVVGLRAAVEQVRARLEQRVSLVSLSTTLATNALVEGHGRAVCLVLIGYEQRHFLRAGLQHALGTDPMIRLPGGHDAAGVPTLPLDVVALRARVLEVKDRVDAFAVSAMFAVRNPEHERLARDVIRQLTGKPVTCGHELSSALDAPRRALTAVLNARLIPLIKALLDATRVMLEEFQIRAPVMVVKGDGSLVSTAFAEESPVETILSGPAASVIGARFLSGSDDLLVSDMGGTTTDIALLRNGMPRLDPAGATVGGWRTMVQAVMINTYGLGGDSAVRFDREQRDFVIGPQRVKPLSLLIHEQPHLIDALREQCEATYTPTYAGQFAVCNTRVVRPVGLTVAQRELLERLRQGPVPLLQLFADQTLDRLLWRLVNRGLVQLSAFTPSDASHVLGEQHDWNLEAAMLGAELQRRYSEYNMGPVLRDASALAAYIRERVAVQSALALVETAIANREDQPGMALLAAERAFLRRTFAAPVDAAVSIDVRLSVPLIALGAPARSYYPRVAELLHTRLELPEHGPVANALGAVIGSVRQSGSLTITPAGGKRVRVHTLTGPQEFEDLEQAVAWSFDTLEQSVSARARSAGAADYELDRERHDNIVENNGDRVFFESVVIVHATGRPATAPAPG